MFTHQNTNQALIHKNGILEFIINKIKEDLKFHHVSMNCSVEMFHKLPHNKQYNKKIYGLRGLIRHYHFNFEPKLGQVSVLN